MGARGFIWWFGVVTDRADPLQAGRYQVRIIGWHGDAVDNRDLPWAQCMQPVSSAAHDGIGSTNALQDGSHVVGFFLDGEQAQMPMIMGSFAGMSQNLDPLPDTPALAYGTEDPSIADKITHITSDVPTAKRHSVVTAEDETTAAEYDTPTWSEPQPRAAKLSRYPFNEVRRTEAGHIFEVDNTPGCERIAEYHSKGTFREVQYDGTVVTKIVGDDYEIIVGGKNVLINGTCNVTINGNARLRVKKDLIQEVMGDHCLTVHGNQITKIGGNESKEVCGSVSHQVNKSETRRITGDQTVSTGGNAVFNVKGSYNQLVVGAYSQTVVASCSFIFSDLKIATSGKLNLASGTDLVLTSGKDFIMKIHQDYKVSYDRDTYTRKRPSRVDYTCSSDTGRTSDSTACTAIGEAW